MVNPTLVTPGPQPVEAAGPGADDVPQVLRGEVVGPRHARRRPADHRRKAAAGAVLLSATGAATALFLLMGKDARQPTAAHDTSSSAPDRPDAHTAAFGDSAVGDSPLRGSRAERPAPAAPAAADRVAPASGTPDARQGHSAASRQDRPSARPGGVSGDWEAKADQLRRWARGYTERHGDGSAGPSAGDGRGTPRHGDAPGAATGQGQGQGQGQDRAPGNGQGGSGHWGGGHRR
ncbi:hypothetical protein [Streptomyces cucumeris]|uniref:hypothetical protein n=1 Tax=Streptomyces cucumeris TaxID=2962890 RepID=UPI003EC13E32